MKVSRPEGLSAPVPTLAQIAPSPIIEDELRWFFHIEDGDPSSSIYGRMLEPTGDDDEWQTRGEHADAQRKHRVILSHVKSLSDSDGGVLQCAYAPRRWTARLAQELGRLTGVVVRLSCDRSTWPVDRRQKLRVDAINAERLHLMLRAGGGENGRLIRDLRREAQSRYTRALGEYVRIRRARSLSRMQ